MTREPQKMTVNNLKYFLLFFFQNWNRKVVFYLGRIWRVRAQSRWSRSYLAADRCDAGRCIATEVQQFLNRTLQVQVYIFMHCSLFCSKPQLLGLAPPKPVTKTTWDGTRRRVNARGSKSKKCSSQRVASICDPLQAIPSQSSQVCGGLRDYILGQSLLFWRSLSTPWAIAGRDLV